MENTTGTLTRILAALCTPDQTGTEPDPGRYPNPAGDIVHLYRKESIIDLVVSIMDMPGRTVFSQRVAPGMSHAGISVAILSTAFMDPAIKNKPGAYAKS